MRIHQERSYVLALENAGQLSGMYIGDGEDALSFRQYGKYLLFGGESHRTGVGGDEIGDFQLFGYSKGQKYSIITSNIIPKKKRYLPWDSSINCSALRNQN